MENPYFCPLFITLNIYSTLIIFNTHEENYAPAFIFYFIFSLFF